MGFSTLVWPISNKGGATCFSTVLLMEEGRGVFPPHIYVGRAKGKRQSFAVSPSFAYAASQARTPLPWGAAAAALLAVRLGAGTPEHGVPPVRVDTSEVLHLEH